MPPSILLLQNDASKAALIGDLLAKANGSPVTIEWFRTSTGALRRLGNRSKAAVAAVLVDLALPEQDELQLFGELFRAAPHIPILVLTSPEREETAKRAVRRGAQDYVLDDRLDSHSLFKALSNMLERSAHAEASVFEEDRAQATLDSIGDAVISTDSAGKISYLNRVAELLTGWANPEAVGRDFDEVVHVVDNAKQRISPNPMLLAMQQNNTVTLPPGATLIRRDGNESAIEDSVAPIHDRTGRLTGAVMVFHDVTETRAMSQQMSYLAHHDYLTNLPNRMLLDDRLAQAMAAARRHGEQLAILFVDIDRFKHINDSLGHAVGDGLLRSVAQRLIAGVRSSDTVSRQGGDEFVILLSRVTHAEDAALTANKILAVLAMMHFVKEHQLQVTASMGISVYPGDGEDAETLIRNADIAMLNAKESGRNNYQFFRSEMNEHALERQSLEGGLRHALDQREFMLHYQPKMDLDTGAVTGAEALIRWRQADGLLVLPGKFIPIAEQCGYIVPIGRWVLREACVQLRTWLDDGLEPLPVAINISAVELRSSDFVPRLRTVLGETNVSAGFLEFELTETALMQDPQSTLAVLKMLKDMGVRITLDDFGTGYSSLSYLKRFPLDALKIDKSFVQGLCTNTDDATIVNAVINMAKSFHLKVIAEGVETREQLLRLQAGHCDEGQGYYFRPPIAAAEYSKLLSSDLSTTAA